MIGYHVPIIKSSFKISIENAHKNSNINAFQLFIKNPRQSALVTYDEKKIYECKNYILENNLFLVIHGSYLLNSATRDNFDNKIKSAMNELIYSEKIGSIGTVFHVGKHLKQSEKIGTDIMYEFISTVINELQEMNSKSIYILETCAGQGTELLMDLKDFGNFYHRFSKTHQNNLKICIDTCHVFSSGYSLKSKKDAEKFIDIVENYIKWENVVLIHLNDSKKDVGCRVDRHENLCKGCICKDDDTGLQYFVKFCYNRNIPIILETPYDTHNMYEIYNNELEQIHNWLNS